jgi:hypothetical protein
MIPEGSGRLTRHVAHEAPKWILALFVVQSLIGLGGRCLPHESVVVSAYIDPGSGALFVQVLVSVAVGFLLYLRRVRQALRRLLPWPRRRDEQAPPRDGSAG